MVGVGGKSLAIQIIFKLFKSLYYYEQYEFGYAEVFL